MPSTSEALSPASRIALRTASTAIARVVRPEFFENSVSPTPTMQYLSLRLAMAELYRIHAVEWPRALSAAVMVGIQRLRQLEWAGAQIAEIVQVSRATVARTLTQLGLARLEALHARPVIVRYEWPRPGQLLHLDIKKLGRIGHVGHRITGDRRGQARGIGWEFVHVCVDDCSRVAYAEVLVDEKGPTVAAV